MLIAPSGGPMSQGLEPWVELGSHPLADELRALGLPRRALFSTFVEKMTGLFYAADKVSR